MSFPFSLYILNRNFNAFYSHSVAKFFGGGLGIGKAKNEKNKNKKMHLLCCISNNFWEDIAQHILFYLTYRYVPPPFQLLGVFCLGNRKSCSINIYQNIIERDVIGDATTCSYTGFIFRLATKRITFLVGRIHNFMLRVGMFWWSRGRRPLSLFL